jgi:hypothetical protein
VYSNLELWVKIDIKTLVKINSKIIFKYFLYCKISMTSMPRFEN